MLSLIKIKDIHQCKDTDPVYAVVRTSPRATHMVRVGDLAPAGGMLVTPCLKQGSGVRYYCSEEILRA